MVLWLPLVIRSEHRNTCRMKPFSFVQSVVVDRNRKCLIRESTLLSRAGTSRWGVWALRNQLLMPRPPHWSAYPVPGSHCLSIRDESLTTPESLPLAGECTVVGSFGQSSIDSLLRENLSKPKQPPSIRAKSPRNCFLVPLRKI